MAEQEHEPSTAELVSQLAEQSSELVREELRLARAELEQKARHAGLGAGLYGASGIIALFGVGTLVATAILSLQLALPAWLSALIVAGVLFLAAGVAALRGKKQISETAPPTPERALESVKQDIATVKEHRR